MSKVLAISSLHARYGDLEVLRGVDLEVCEGEIVAILGTNGAGKTTLLRAISGVVSTTGSIRFHDESIDSLPPHVRVERGIVHVPEGRGIFPFLSVEENLELGAFPAHARGSRRAARERVLELFPPLKNLLRRRAGSLSGGEQQMVAIGRGLMSKPKLLLLDEPSFGLAPMIFDKILDAIQSLNKAGLTIVLVEQAVQEALDFVHRGYVLGEGHVVLSGKSDILRSDARLHDAYFGERLQLASENGLSSVGASIER
jgi:branched-chain amino acid transport system ATP-binding protein